MYFWKVDDLVRDLRAGIVSEYDKMKYFLFEIVLVYLGLFGNIAHGDTPTAIITMFFMVFQLAIVVWGTYHCFVINKQHDNKNFLERYICLRFPLMIRFAVYVFLGLLVLALIFVLGHISVEHSYKVIHQSSKVIIHQSRGVLARNTIGGRSNLLLQILAESYALILSIIFYIILGRKIAAVSVPEKK